MEHDLELFIPILEILEIEVCNILYNPGNIEKLIFQFSPTLEILENDAFQWIHKRAAAAVIHWSADSAVSCGMKFGGW